MTQKRGLGRGLGALIPGAGAPGGSQSSTAPSSSAADAESQKPATQASGPSDPGTGLSDPATGPSSDPAPLRTRQEATAPEGDSAADDASAQVSAQRGGRPVDMFFSGDPVPAGERDRERSHSGRELADDMAKAARERRRATKNGKTSRNGKQTRRTAAEEKRPAPEETAETAETTPATVEEKTATAPGKTAKAKAKAEVGVHDEVREDSPAVDVEPGTRYPARPQSEAEPATAPADAPARANEAAPAGAATSVDDAAQAAELEPVEIAAAEVEPTEVAAAETNTEGATPPAEAPAPPTAERPTPGGAEKNPPRAEEYDADKDAFEDCSEDSLVPVPGAKFAEIPIQEIRENPRNPRTVFDEDALDELAYSLREVGVLQPVVVRAIPRTPGGEAFELVMGERRWRAAQRAGLTAIPAIVRDTTDDDLLRDALLENLHRSELNPLEEAAAYQQLLDDFNCTQDELAERIGRSRPQISNTLRLMRLPAVVQRRVAAGALSAGHARALLGLEDTTLMEELAARVVAEGLSVRQVEKLVATGASSSGSKTPPRRNSYNPQVVAYTSRLSTQLEAPVKIDMGKRKGRITMEFTDLQDLERLMDRLGLADD